MHIQNQASVNRPWLPSGLVALLCLAALGGCAVGPDFAAPTPAVPRAWIGSAISPASQPENLAAWWTAFKDSELTSLVKQALESNLDIRIAASRIRQARANRGIAMSGLGPSVDASGSFQRSKTSGGQLGGSQTSAGQPAAGTNLVTNQYQAGFDAGWEIDIFGGVRRGAEVADAQLLSAVEDRRDVQVTLAAEVAQNYITLRASQQRLAIARRNLAAQKHSAEVTRQKFEGGLVSRLDVANADAQVATTTSQIPMLESSARQTVYAMAALLDREPGALVQELSAPAEVPATPPAVPAGVPSDLLQRRPDIRRAEANIHSATANIGVATADLFPKVTIDGSLGWQSANAGSLFDPLSRFWSFGPSVTWNVFQSGKTLSNIEVQRAIQEQSLLTYRQTVLAAVQEVENALIASAKEQEHRQSLADAVAANRLAVELATKLYAEGHTDFLNVLSAQQALLTSEDALVQSVAAISLDFVALYKALGGGWEDQPQTTRMERK